MWNRRALIFPVQPHTTNECCCSIAAQCSHRWDARKKRNIFENWLSCWANVMLPFYQNHPWNMQNWEEKQQQQQIFNYGEKHPAENSSSENILYWLKRSFFFSNRENIKFRYLFAERWKCNIDYFSRLFWCWQNSKMIEMVVRWMQLQLIHRIWFQKIHVIRILHSTKNQCWIIAFGYPSDNVICV